jgi:hypothetical protein
MIIGNEGYLKFMDDSDNKIILLINSEGCKASSRQYDYFFQKDRLYGGT